MRLGMEQSKRANASSFLKPLITLSTLMHTHTYTHTYTYVMKGRMNAPGESLRLRAPKVYNGWRLGFLPHGLPRDEFLWTMNITSFLLSPTIG